MAALTPFRMEPRFMERPWGTRSLAPLYAREVAATEAPIGEVWLTGDECRVATGEHSGLSLAELTQRFGAELTGDAAPSPQHFPLLIKFLFPREKLSVQVHPDDDGARRLGQPCGKTECWYVLAAEPGAQVALGLKPGTTRQELRQAIAETRAEELLQWIPLNAGEMIYAEAGTVHAIGPGSILVETQQNSDTTYRLYDYGRPRPLHIEEGLAAAKEVTNAGKVVPHTYQNSVTLVASPCFVVNKRTLTAGNEQILTRHMPPSSVQIVVALAGSGEVRAAGSEAVSFERGQAVVVPASISGFSVLAREPLEYLHVALPQEKLPHPQTS